MLQGDFARVSCPLCFAELRCCARDFSTVAQFWHDFGRYGSPANPCQQQPNGVWIHLYATCPACDLDMLIVDRRIAEMEDVIRRRLETLDAKYATKSRISRWLGRFMAWTGIKRRGSEPA